MLVDFIFVEVANLRMELTLCLPKKVIHPYSILHTELESCISCTLPSSVLVTDIPMAFNIRRWSLLPGINCSARSRGAVLEEVEKYE